jgi:hypothetical protein
METTIRYIARSITDSRRPLPERAKIIRWVRGTCWAPQVELLVSIIAQDQAFASHARN